MQFRNNESSSPVLSFLNALVSSEDADPKKNKPPSELWTFARPVDLRPSMRWAHEWAVADIDGVVFNRGGAGDGASDVAARAAPFLLASSPGHPALFHTGRWSPQEDFNQK